MLAERGGILIDGESRPIGRDLEQNPARLQKIDRFEPESVDHFRRTPPILINSLAHLELRLVIRHTPCDVMNASCSPSTTVGVGDLADLQIATGTAPADLEAE